jgi:hypothetical protein
MFSRCAGSRLSIAALIASVWESNSGDAFCKALSRASAVAGLKGMVFSEEYDSVGD